MKIAFQVAGSEFVTKRIDALLVTNLCLLMISSFRVYRYVFIEK
jgi:hypothetical protein